MASRKRDARDTRGSGIDRSGGRASHESEAASPAIDLLELGPDDAAELLEFEESGPLKAKIKVVGVGGGGGNAAPVVAVPEPGTLSLFAIGLFALALFRRRTTRVAVKA